MEKAQLQSKDVGTDPQMHGTEGDGMNAYLKKEGRSILANDDPTMKHFQWTLLSWVLFQQPHSRGN